MMRTALRFAGVAGVILFVALVRVIYSSYDELQAGDTCVERSDAACAIVHYRRAARWYAPGNPFSKAAITKLTAIAKSAEERGERDLALQAYRAVRTGILSTRSFYTPHREVLDRTNERIAELMASLPRPPMDAKKSHDALRAEHLKLLQHDPSPKIGWTLLLLAGFLAWIAGAFIFIERAFDRDERLIRKEAQRWGAMILVGLLAFFVGLFLA